MWGVVARIAAAAAVLTLVQHNISQMYKAYYDERMKEEAGPTKLFPKIDPDDRDGTARGRREEGAERGRRRGRVDVDRDDRVRGRRVGRRRVATGDALASRRAPGGVGGAASGGGASDGDDERPEIASPRRFARAGRSRADDRHNRGRIALVSCNDRVCL